MKRELWGLIILSILLLIVFIWINYCHPYLLILETRWIIISGIPILIGLIVGGYITKFKGFGIELESNLKKPIESANLIQKITAQDVPSQEKESMQLLERMHEADKSSIKRLKFILGKEDYYTSPAILQYLRQLQNLDFIEFTTNDGRLKYLIDYKVIDVFEEEESYLSMEDLAHQIIKTVKSKRLDESLLKYEIIERIKEDSTQLKVAKKFTTTNYSSLPVVSKDNKMIGVVYKRKFLEQFLEQLLAEVVKTHS